MTGQRTIYVDFNNRIRPKEGEFFKVDLEELDGLRLFERVRATDRDELEFEVVVVARRNDLGYGIVELDRTAGASEDVPGNSQPFYLGHSVQAEAIGSQIGPQELVGAG